MPSFLKSPLGNLLFILAIHQLSPTFRPSRHPNFNTLPNGHTPRINQHKFHMRYFLLFICLFLTRQYGAAQFLYTYSAQSAPYNTPANLIRNHLADAGIEVLDVQYSGSPLATGYFTGGEPSVGLKRGLLMSTGRVASQGIGTGADKNGINFASSSFDISFPDPLLETISTGNQFDLVRYRVTFRTQGDSIRFRYVFASEEYPEYTCYSFNDVFGFFLEGPGYAGAINIARIPNSNLPVAINNIHPLNSDVPDCLPMNEQFYHDNNNSNLQPAYDGFLDIFTAEAAVQPCAEYVMTLALADIFDHTYDSAVFLEAQSFGSNADVNASFEPGEAILTENAAADTIKLHFGQIPATLFPLQVEIGGTAQNGIDYLPVNATTLISISDTTLCFLFQPVSDSLNEILETITITIRNTACFYQSFTIYLADPESGVGPLDSLVFNGDTELTAPGSILSELEWAGSNQTEYGIPMIMSYSHLVVEGLDNAALRQLIGENINGVPALETLIDRKLLKSVCVNVEHPWTGYLRMYLFAPNGQFLELSTNNGEYGANYQNTCFTPDAPGSITFGQPFAPSSAAPFTGSFQPEGEWNDLLNAPIPGIWSLGFLDNQQGFTGTLKNWSLAFSAASLDRYQYLWSTGETSETITASTPGTYSVSVSNAMGTFTKTFVVHLPCDVTDSLNVVIAPGETFTFGNDILNQAGYYTHTYPAANGCDSIIVLHLQLSTATNEAGAQTTLLIAPNPAGAETMLQLPAGTYFAQIRVYDMQGRQVLDQSVGRENNYRLNTAGWASGWYTVIVVDTKGAIAQGRVLLR